VRLLFLNLARNSCRYTEAEKIEIEISSRNGVILYRDNGVGIPQAEWKHVFDDFVRLAGPETRQGTGLGLAICRRVMEAHGGRIAIRDSTGSGTVFEIGFRERPSGGAA
jgi:signal transduction histidine kinase